MRTVNVQITWPDATCIVGVAGYLASQLSAPVSWKGDARILAKLPQEIAPGAGAKRCSLICLLTHGENFAESEGATFTWSAEGEYELVA